jgi:hypothetical protein
VPFLSPFSDSAVDKVTVVKYFYVGKKNLQKSQHYVLVSDRASKSHGKEEKLRRVLRLKTLSSK